MLEFALVDKGHRLEAAMGMLANAAGSASGREFEGSGVIEHQERAQGLRPLRSQEKSDRFGSAHSREAIIADHRVFPV